MIPYARQSINEDDIAAVVKVLQSDFLTQGPVIPQFEEAVAKISQAAYAIATNSATSALHLACLALGLESGDWLWTSPITFVASANCALYCGANVDFVDIDEKTYNLCPKALESKLIKAEKLGLLPKIVIPVHFSGQSCDMKAIHTLSQRYGFKIIEDASHAIGGQYEALPIGHCRYSDATIFSFHPVKIITSGEGGMVVTNQQPIAERVALLRSHGITRDPKMMTGPSQGPWYYQQLALGFNYRMTDIQAALGLSQTQRLTAFIARRRQIAACYDQHLGNLPVVLPYQLPSSNSAWHLYVLQLLGNQRLNLFNQLQAEGIYTNVHYIPVHLQPYYQKLGFHLGQFPQAEKFYAQALSLPMYYELTEAQQEKIIKVLKQCF